MSQGVPALLGQGLIMTVLGMALVFAALALLWGMMAALGRIFRPEPVGDTTAASSEGHAAAAETSAADVLTAERAHVAAIVAGALLANVLPAPADVLPGPGLEPGSAASCWVTANRARALEPWQPPRSSVL